jgi:hypothetical protein
MAYSVLDNLYMNGLIKKIEGEPAATTTEVTSINDPDETYVPLGPTEGDPKVFSYAYGQDPAILVAKVSTAGGSSTCKYTLAAPDAGGGKAWKVLARDVILTYTDPGTEETAEVVTNPYGLAQLGNSLYLIDYDSRFIYTLGVNELNGLAPGNHELAYTPFDPNPGTSDNLPVTAKGQAIIVVKDAAGNPFLFALYTDPDNTVYPPWHRASWLVKIAVDPVYGVLSYAGTIKTLAKNAQELIYIADFDGSPGLLIPAIGGPQKFDGTTNGVDSKLELVRPFDSTTSSTMSTQTLLTGDADPTPPATPTTWDIKAVAAAPDTTGSSPIFILTGTMDTNDNQNWRLYATTATQLRKANNTSLSAAVTAAYIWESDSGTGAPGNYWDIYYENGTGPTSSGDRLWFLKGSPILVGAAAGFPNNPKTFPVGYAQGQIGGINVDSATLVSETMKQAAKGVSLKRGLRGIAAVTPPEEEEK